MSVYITLNTSRSPDLGEIIQFAETAKALGLDPKSQLVAATKGPNELSVVIPLDHLPVVSRDDS